MRTDIRIATVVGIAALLTGCQVLASLFEDSLLRGLALLVAVAAVLGLLVSRMRR